MTGKDQDIFSSRFGYVMVAAGAAVGLGNIWRFPYMAYRDGGGIFILISILGDLKTTKKNSLSMGGTVRSAG